MTMAAPTRKTTFARYLRRNQTESEFTFWRLIRGRQFVGLKFRRQHPIGPYIADFYCPRAKLIIELDGSHDQKQIAYDESRTLFLEKQGYRVLRFWDNDLLLNPDGVVQVILEACTAERAPSPQPSPQKGEGDKGWRPLL